jgi:alpha-ketoglutarate-dependent taurine dioxygenase
MKHIEAIEFPGIMNVLENIDIYKEKFLKESVILFRNANLSYEDQSFLHNEMGKIFNYIPVLDKDSRAERYVENHSTRNLIGVAGKDDILLDWHLEHVIYKNPIVMSTWNMVKFRTDSENGKTYFVDCQKVYEDMPPEWKNFLNRCKINYPGKQSWNSDEEWPVIAKHWITESPVIRVVVREFPDNANQLVFVDDRTPTDLEIKLFEEILTWIGNYIYNKEDARIVQKWQEGDLLMVDIFKLAHAVTGGFAAEDREFFGIWGYKN